MGPVIVKGITIGTGRPKICVPLVGATIGELLEEAKLVKALFPDLAELRIDHFSDVGDPRKVVSAVKEVAWKLDGLPLLFTFRTKREGGTTDMDDAHCAELYAAVCGSGAVDLVDVELFTPAPIRDAMIAGARERGVFAVVSNHDFDKTPGADDMADRLVEAARVGDIAKLAVMPRSPEDVLALLSATVSAGKRAGGTPIISMSMGALGSVSRFTGEFFGSAVSFGSAKKASAPGQIPAEQLRFALNIMHDAKRSDR